MGKYKIASVINYSSYHNAFIDQVVKEAKMVSDYVVVVSYDCFFDGQRDMGLRTTNADDHVILRYIPGRDQWHHESDQRRLGYQALSSHYDFIFFIDSDEVLESKVVNQWLDTIEEDNDYKLAHFWYYRDTCYRADVAEEGAVLVSTNSLESADWYHYLQRGGFSKRWHHMAAFGNKVLGHHYSWAGTKEMMLRKVQTWGHRDDRQDWAQMVEKEYSHPFDYTCPFKPDYGFVKIDPYVDFTFENK